MDISINASVHCPDGPVGHIISVIINPQDQNVTHLVVETKTFPKEARMVPVNLVAEATPTTINLKCKRADVGKLDQFFEHEFVKVNMPMLKYAPLSYVVWPYAEPETNYTDIIHEHIPPGELAVRRGAEIDATDGPVGKVDAFLIDPQYGNITHLILKEGHLWGKKDVMVPITAIDTIEENCVSLNIDKTTIAELPLIPIKRWWR